MRFAVSNETMRYSDRMTIEGGVPSLELMKRAGEGIYNANRTGWGEKIAVVCGSGNNGGDGYVLALCLHKAGLFPTLVLVEEKCSADGAFYFEECKKRGIPHILYSSEFDFSQYDSVADCIFGTGFHGEVQGISKECIERMNENAKFIVSADINSGISGDGSFSGTCVHSDLVVAIGAYKIGHFLGQARDHIKKMACIDIGIEIKGEKYFVPEIDDFSRVIEQRLHNSHKGTYGYTAIIGGCLEYSGAAKLANLAACAMRCGCGVIKLAVARSVCSSVAPYLLESTLFPIDDTDGHMNFDEERFASLLNGTTAVSCGMGWGKGSDNEKILTYLLKNYNGTLIIDADGLNTLANIDRSVIRNNVCKKIVLTPHPLEFSRISGFSMQKIASDAVGCVREYLSLSGGNAVVLLKGASTVVADDEKVYIIDRGCPGMATAGSGDVLSGVLTGLLGYTKATAESVAFGAFLAAYAGEMAQQEFGSVSMIASDTVKKIPDALKAIMGKNGR